MCSPSLIWRVGYKTKYIFKLKKEMNSVLLFRMLLLFFILFACVFFRSCVFTDGYSRSPELCRELKSVSTGCQLVCGQDTHREHGNVLPRLPDS